MLEAIRRHFFERLNRSCRPVRFIQIGAGDGVSNDPIHPFVRQFGWQGLLVEPVKDVFERLRHNYRGVEGLTFVNCSIGATSGERTFFRVRPPASASKALANRCERLGSFSRDVILAQSKRIRKIERYIVPERIPCVTMNELVCGHGMGSIDLLVTDAEGHDAEILESAGLDRLSPEIIHYERHHHSVSVQVNLAGLLERLGYVNIPIGIDCIAVKADSLGVDEMRLLAAAVGVLAKREYERRVLSKVVGKSATLRVTRERGNLHFRRLSS